MKKFLITALIISSFALSGLIAKTTTYKIILKAYVPERVTFQATENGYTVNSNTSNVSYDFTDANGNSTDAYNASVFNVVAP